MKTYPSIPKNIRTDIPIIAFAKLDGSNIRAEWNIKKGFHKFGSKTQLIDESTKTFGKAIQLIKDKYQDDLSVVFKDNRWQDTTCFFEFFGPNSFAGNHAEEEQTVVLFDVNPYKQGIMEPRQFLKLFGHLDIPAALYEGKANSELIAAVKNSTLDNMPLEGVVCKGANDKKTKMPIMFKIKSDAWLQKLKNFCKDDMKLFEQLS